ncbi:MAG TPA: DNA repair protein RecN [Verrucomicrobia bacterium]|nr:DNA repair protein RecN [Verrucomicrobiota bacterium]
MLSNLHIRNLAIVDEVKVGFSPGLNVITGETGAGKSMLADALNLILGERADKSIIRSGETQCQVEALFSLASTAALDSVLEEAGLSPCDEGNLIIRRIVASSGAGKIIVNDSPATVQILKRLGMLLVDMHGPHEHQSLLDPTFQRDVLDAYGHLTAAVEAYATVYRKLLDLQADRRAIDGPDQETAARLDMLRFQITELDAADLEHTDEDALRQEHLQNANAARIIELGDAICNALLEEDASAFNALAVARRSIPELAELIPDGRGWADEIEAISVQIKELAAAVGAEARRIEADPERLQWLEDRMALLQKLKRKYGADVPAMLAFLEQARQQARDLETRGERLQALDAQIAEALRGVETAGGMLTRERRTCSTALAKAITVQLHDLGFSHARFGVTINPCPPSAYGMDIIDYAFSPNPGETLRSLKDIASSGEISRVMLAVKTVLAGHDRIPVLFFDEIDANLGGEMGNAVGRKLAEVAGSHQVICITHLPQVAVHGATHFVVAKAVQDGRTRTSIRPIQGDTRAEEVARMLGGKDLTSVTLRHAREMLHLPA